MDQEFDSLEALWATAKIPPEASGCMSYEAFLPLIRVHASTQGYKLMDSEARVMFLASLPRTGANSSVSDAGRGGGSCIGSSGRVALEDVKRTLETSPWRLAAARAAEFSALELAATAAGTFVRRPGAACASLIEPATAPSSMEDAESEPGWSALAALASPLPSPHVSPQHIKPGVMKEAGGRQEEAMRHVVGASRQERSAASRMPVGRRGGTPRVRTPKAATSASKDTTVASPGSKVKSSASQRGTSEHTSAKVGAARTATTTGTAPEKTSARAENVNGASKSSAPSSSRRHRKRLIKRAKTEAVMRTSIADDATASGGIKTVLSLATGAEVPEFPPPDATTPAITIGGDGMPALASSREVAAGVGELVDAALGAGASGTISSACQSGAVATNVGGSSSSSALLAAATVSSPSPTLSRLRKTHPGLSSDELREARKTFAHADSDGNGVLDFTEFCALLRKVKMSPQVGSRTHEARPQLTDAELRDLFERADMDGSGTIELDEFIAMQLKHRAALGAAAFAKMALAREEPEDDSELAVSEVASPGLLQPKVPPPRDASRPLEGFVQLEVSSSSAPTTQVSYVAEKSPASELPVSHGGAVSSNSSVHEVGVADGHLPGTSMAAVDEPSAKPAQMKGASFHHSVIVQPPDKPISPLRRNQTMPALGQVHQEESQALVDERYRELMRTRAVESALKAPRPDVSSEDLDMLEVLFQSADTNHDGVVDFAEFKELMHQLSTKTGKKYNALQLRGLFRIADLDRSGSIDFNEFLHAQRRVRKAWGTAKVATVLSMAVGRSAAARADSAAASKAE